MPEVGAVDVPRQLLWVSLLFSFLCRNEPRVWC